MRAIVLHAEKDLRVEERPVKSPGPTQVRIGIAAGGICGSDLHYYNHGGFGTVRLREPMILGHEVSGHVLECGDNVRDLSVGDLVAVSPSRPCRFCRYCQEGLQNQCENMRFYGSAMPFPHIQGAFREELVADASQCTIANGLPPGEAALAEPLAVCLHAVRRAGPLVGKRVLVTGCGPIGLLTILCARRAGAAEIVATDIAPAALPHAEARGADRVIDVAAHPDELAAFGTGKGYFDVLFEASGANAALSSAIAVLRPRGIVVQLGMGGDMTLPVLQITVKELELRGSFRFHEEFPMAVELMRKGLIEAGDIITHTFGLDEAHAAFETANDRSKALKAQIALT